MNYPKTASVADGLVVDVERWHPGTSSFPDRTDGLVRILCPSWITVGCLFNGEIWTLADGTVPADEDVQTTWEQLTLIERLSDEELLALEDICLPGHPARATGVRIRAAMLGAVETYSRTARTKVFIDAAIQLGIVADVERARVILDDPGFSLE